MMEEGLLGDFNVHTANNLEKSNPDISFKSAFPLAAAMKSKSMVEKARRVHLYRTDPSVATIVTPHIY